jgi:hypothetical protein
MSYVGLDPQAASELARHLDEAARDLESHASTVTSLLDQAGIVSCEAPAQLREIAGWAAYRSRDLRRRIDNLLAADSGASGTRAPGFRFAGRGNARKAGADEADRIRALLDGHHPKKLAAGLAKAMSYLADPDFAAGFFKGLGPKETFNLLSATRGNDLLVVGRALAGALRAGKLGPAFFDGISNAAKKQAAALDAYMHGAGGISARDRKRYAVDEYVQRAGAPPGTYAALETIAPLTPLLEAGAKVAVIGGAVAIVTLGAASVVTTAGAWIEPAAALGGDAFVAFSDSGIPVVVDLEVPAADALGGLTEQLSVVHGHLTTINALTPENQAMLERISAAQAAGRALTFAEQNFLRHELVEDELMHAGVPQGEAHLLAGLTHPTFANYDPEVIRAYPDVFNNDWRAYWGIQ